MLFFVLQYYAVLYCLQFHHLTAWTYNLIGQDGIPSWQINLLQECSDGPSLRRAADS